MPHRAAASKKKRARQQSAEPATPYKPAPDKPVHNAMRPAADLLQALESLRDEIGSLADDIISALRGAGVTPTHAPKSR